MGLSQTSRPLSVSLIHLIPIANQSKASNARIHSIQLHHGTMKTQAVQVQPAHCEEAVSMIFATAEVSRSGALPLVPFLAVSTPAIEAGLVQQVTEA